MNSLFSLVDKQKNNLCTIYNKMEVGLQTFPKSGKHKPQFELFDEQLKKADNEKGRVGLGGVFSEQFDQQIYSSSEGCLLWNGYLFNSDELRLGLSLNTTQKCSDLELVFTFIQKNGFSKLNALKGYWSFVYLDKKNKQLYGARDPIGNRPLWFCSTAQHFGISSSGRSFHQTLAQAKGINKNTVVDFLLWGNIGKFDACFYEKIQIIPPAHFIKYDIDNQSYSVDRYFEMPYNKSRLPFILTSEEEYISNIRELMHQSVQKNLTVFGDNVAVGLSGGMDSSSLACLAKRDTSKTIVAYTTTDEYDGGEAKWAQKVVKHLGIEWERVECNSQQIVEQLQSVNCIHDAPIYNASSFTQFRLMNEISENGHRYTLDGQGGDELFGGYPKFFPLFLTALRKDRYWKEWWYEWKNMGNSGSSSKSIAVRSLKEWAKSIYFTPERLAIKKRSQIYDSITPEYTAAYFSTHPVDTVLVDKKVLNDDLFESYTYLLDNILRWSLNAASSVGVQAVMPLSNYLPLSEYVFSIPSNYKIHNGWNKYLQRKAMEGIVPKEVQWRKEKLGFYFPEPNWLNEMKEELFSQIEILNDPEGIVNKTYIKTYGRKYFSSNYFQFQRFIFRCYSYLLWRNSLDS